MALCEWGSCTNEDTPFVLTCPDVSGDGKVRKRFCCFEHLAAWAIRRSAGSLATFSNKDEQELLEKVRLLIPKKG
jgi:hypothetical protein